MLHCGIRTHVRAGGPLPLTNDVKPVIKSICYMEYVSSPRGGSMKEQRLTVAVDSHCG
jgi:hypothetical protein